ncbi:MAG: signal peptidase I [Acidimicrobiales bacterium]|nr:signal peptidase I [Acidimicrobiales bacterium]
MTPDAVDPSPAAPPVDDGLARRREREVAGPGPADVDAGTEGAPTAPAPERRATAPAGKSTARNLFEWALVVVGALFIAIIVRTFLFQTFYIPSPSMSPTLVENDRVLVNKLSYELHDVNRGDVVVFERPPNEPPSEIKDLIKRVVGLPGEHVSILEGQVRIDGRILEEPYVNGLDTTTDNCGTANVPGIDTTEGFEVPEGTVLVMGDNRVNSQDGRCFGPIDQDLIVGRAFFILWPLSHAGGL